jgi:hypothetical protein
LNGRSHSTSPTIRPTDQPTKLGKAATAGKTATPEFLCGNSTTEAWISRAAQAGESVVFADIFRGFQAVLKRSLNARPQVERRWSGLAMLPDRTDPGLPEKVVGNGDAVLVKSVRAERDVH